MNRYKTLYVGFLTLISLGGLKAQNVGIGEPTPTAKLHVKQSADATGVLIEQSGATARGQEIQMKSTTTAYGHSIFQEGLGGGSYVDLINSSNNIIGSLITHRGLGVGTQIDLTNNANNSSIAFLRTAGIGRGLEIELTNPSNSNVGSAIFHRGNDGIGHYVAMTNTAAANSSLGMLIQYSGTGGGTGGGGNALEVQHTGTNGNAVDIFAGDPAGTPGPSNTTNEYAALSISHMGTGRSSTLNAFKAAINAINYSDDPTIIAQNLGNSEGSVIAAYAEPSTPSSAFSSSVYARADKTTPNGYGVGVWGDGGNYGVIGGTSTNTNSSNFGLFSLTNSGASGTKSFVIDHPTEPTQKTLRHFSVESNEVLNLYRGIVRLDANGQGVVELPDYFDAINKNVTYQLTPIGTGVQPYVAVEAGNNQFVVGGAPNTKVSWTIYAERNDPTLRYFERVKGEDYKSPVTLKKAHEQGKYLVPEAYGQPKEAGVFYNARREQQAEKALRKEGRQQAAPTPSRQKHPTERLVPSSK